MSAQQELVKPTFEQLAERVDEAMRAVAELHGSARAAAEELKAAIEAVHRAGLVTIVGRMRSDTAAREILFDLVDDPVVHMLLALHGIVRPDPVTEANRALVAVRPQLQSHGGDVTLVRIDDAVAYVRLEGACNGCSMSSVTLRNLVEQALVDNVAAIKAVEVVPNEPSPTLIPLDALRTGSPRNAEARSAEGWANAGPAGAVPTGTVTPMHVTADGDADAIADIIVVNLDERLSAYRNECAHQGLPLDNAILDAGNGTLTCPWHGFCFDASSGECLSAPGAQLEQLPLRIEDGHIWVRVRT